MSHATLHINSPSGRKWFSVDHPPLEFNQIWRFPDAPVVFEQGLGVEQGPVAPWSPWEVAWRELNHPGRPFYLRVRITPTDDLLFREVFDEVRKHVPGFKESSLSQFVHPDWRLRKRWGSLKEGAYVLAPMRR